jgi:FixJ family two-component response regulator
MGHKLLRISKERQFKNKNRNRFNSLTFREYEIVILIVNDFNNPQIAEELYISRYTVEQHRKNINRKLATNTYNQLYQYALAFDLV